MDRERTTRYLQTFLRPLLPASLQQSLNLQVIHTHLNMLCGHTDTERDLGCLVDSVWPTISLLAMDEIKSLKTSVNCKFSIDIACWDDNPAVLVSAGRTVLTSVLRLSGEMMYVAVRIHSPSR